MPPSLCDRLHAGLLVAPGVYDALTASLAAAAGFEALYVSGAAIAYTRLGRKRRRSCGCWRWRCR